MPDYTFSLEPPVRHVGEIKRPQPGEILLVPQNNRLYTPEVMPVDNSKGFPDWFKELDPDKRGLKRCQGTQDYLMTGVTFRLHNPVKFRKTPDGQQWESRWESSDGNMNPSLRIDNFRYEDVGPHQITDQRDLPNGNFIKLVNPWEVVTAPGWSSMLIPCAWNYDRRYELISGVVHTDFYHHMNWVINIQTDEDFIIPAGTPIGTVVTFPRFIKQNVLWGDESAHQFLMNEPWQMAFEPNSIKRLYRRRQRAEDKKCPFSESDVTAPTSGRIRRFLNRITGKM